MQETQRRESIISIGQRLFSRYGYRDVSIEDVTKEAGLGTGSFYAYFSSKEAFYNEILDRLEARSIAEAERLVSRFRSPVNKLKALYRFFTLSARSNEFLRGILTDDRKYTFPGSEARKDHGSMLMGRIEVMLEAVLLEGVQKKVFRCGAYKNPKRMLFSISQVLLQEFIRNEHPQELVEDIFVLLERGLKRRLRLRKRDERIDRRHLNEDE